MKIAVTGATGFIGSNLCRRLVLAGHEVLALARDPERGSTLPPNVTAVKADITQPETLADIFHGCMVVINLVGIIREVGKSTFQQVHAEGTRNVVHAAEAAGVTRLVQMSAVGTRANAASRYHQTKWLAEEYVRASKLEWSIIRPSLVFGKGDGFTTTLIDLIHKAPVIPVIGSGKNLMQPIAVEDVVAVFLAASEGGDHIGKTYEIGGPEHLPYRQIVRMIARQLGSRKPLVSVPIALMSPVAGVMSRITSRFPLTPDQLAMLKEDNVASPNHAQTVFSLNLINFSDGLKKMLAG